MRWWHWLIGGGVALAIVGRATRSRSPQAVLDAVATIDPENAPDLQPGAPPAPPDGSWCNKFVDRLMGLLSVPFAPWGEYGTLVNDQIAWVDAGNGGWYPILNAGAAQVAALAGKVVIATFYNLNGHGHIAVVLPIDGVPLQIAQAGATNFNQGTLRRGFGSNITPIFYAHD